MSNVNVQPYDKNAKKHPNKQIELIASSIRDFGWQQPIKIGQNGVIIVGHGRWLAYEKFKDIYNLNTPWIVDEDGVTVSGEAEKRKLSITEERDYRIRDNKISESGEWDMDLLIPELKDLSIQNVDIRLSGFSLDVIVEDKKEDDAVPDKPITPISKLGDIYELGNHRLICGDATHCLGEGSLHPIAHRLSATVRTYHVRTH